MPARTSPLSASERLRCTRARIIATKQPTKMPTKSAAASRIAIDGLVDSEGAIAGLTIEPALNEAAFAEAVSPEHFVTVRERFGGPGPQALAAAFAGYRGVLVAAGLAATATAAREASARHELDAAFADLMGAA